MYVWSPDLRECDVLYSKCLEMVCDTISIPVGIPLRIYNCIYIYVVGESYGPPGTSDKH